MAALCNNMAGRGQQETRAAAAGPAETCCADQAGGSGQHQEQGCGAPLRRCLVGRGSSSNGGLPGIWGGRSMQQVVVARVGRLWPRAFVSGGGSFADRAGQLQIA